MYKQDKLTPGQEEDKKERRKQLKALDKAIFHSGPNRANPWAKKKAVGESMTFIQHLLENEPSSKEKLLEVNSEDFLNVLLAASGEEPLREGELEGFPTHMTVGELMDIFEARPDTMADRDRSMGLDADESQWRARDSGSVKRGNKRRTQMADRYDRRNFGYDKRREEEEEPSLPAARDVVQGMRNNPEPAHDAPDSPSRKRSGQRIRRQLRADGKVAGRYKDRRPNAYNPSDGSEQEETKAPADNEVFKMVSNRSQRLSKANQKRYDQNIRRMRRSYTGKKDERGNYDS